MVAPQKSARALAQSKTWRKHDGPCHTRQSRGRGRVRCRCNASGKRGMTSRSGTWFRVRNAVGDFQIGPAFGLVVAKDPRSASKGFWLLG